MSKQIVYFHRGQNKGFSINKVTQTIVREISDKREYYVPYSRASILDILKNMWFIYKHRDKHAINHITGDIHYGIIPLIGCKSVLTVHDTVMIDYNSIRGIKRILAKLLWFKLPLMFATKVICISESTKQSLKKYTSRNDIIVIHNAVDPSFKQIENRNENKVPNILVIGTKKNKNLERTFEALNGIRCTVTIIGKLTDTQIQVLHDNNIHYVNKCNLSDEELINEYCKADIISFISLFEGFGMIIIEANKIGRPVICSNISVLQEIGGDSVFYVDPYNIDEIHQGFVQLIFDKNLTNMLVNKGFENVSRFEANSIRSEWLRVYEQL